MAMKSYRLIFPEAGAPVMTLDLSRKAGGIPKGSYGFYEYYCTEPGCDCRRVTLIVYTEKMKPRATISLGFDQLGPFAGPFLDASSYQAPYAPALLDFFVDTLNSRPDWLTRMYRQYREVRELVDGKPYRGKAFPEPGEFTCRATPPPDLEAVLEQSLKERELKAAVRGKSAAGPGATPAEPPVAKPGPVTSVGMAHFVDLYAKVGSTAPVGRLLALQDELRRYLLLHDGAGEEFAALLPELCLQSPQNEEKIDAALRVLYDLLDFYQVALEGDRPGSKLQMERFQRALARRVFSEFDDTDLQAAVANILLHSRVRLHPVLRDASRGTVADSAFRADLHETQGEDLLAGIARSLESRRITSPFAAVQQMFELFAVNDPELQLPVLGEMMTADQPLLRDVAALMLFHPRADVSIQVSQLLCRIDGGSITPQTLRRLIVSRNWFPETARKHVDQAITNARKAHVECAQLAKPPALTVYATSVDGSGGQGFHVVVPAGTDYIACTVILKAGSGVANSYESTLHSKRQLERFLADSQKGHAYLECSADYLDLRVCHALADGVACGRTPNHWLVLVAEIIGRDRWKGVPFDAGNELLQLRDELAARDPRLVEEKEYLAALRESAHWLDPGQVLGAWFEDDEEVQHEIEASLSGRTGLDTADVVGRLLSNVLEARRDLWLQRLVINTLWLKHAVRAPVAWHKMFHVAQGVADTTVPLKEIPLMVSIARYSFEMYQRIKTGRYPSGAKG